MSKSYWVPRRGTSFKDAYQEALVKAAQEHEKQYLVDMLCLVLHDHYGFGGKRLQAVIELLLQEHDDNAVMFNFNTQAEADEALRRRCHLDANLHQLFKDKFSSFDERYPHAKKVRIL